MLVGSLVHLTLKLSYRKRLILEHHYKVSWILAHLTIKLRYRYIKRLILAHLCKVSCIVWAFTRNSPPLFQSLLPSIPDSFSTFNGKTKLLQKSPIEVQQTQSSYMDIILHHKVQPEAMQL